jgi:uncharacterized protein
VDIPVIEWDETKRQSNIIKHGFDFLRAEDVLYGSHVVIPSKYASNEQRFLAIGVIEDRFATVVYTMRDGNLRIISIRSARDGERRKYQAVYG